VIVTSPQKRGLCQRGGKVGGANPRRVEEAIQKYGSGMVGGGQSGEGWGEGWEVAYECIFVGEIGKCPSGQ